MKQHRALKLAISVVALAALLIRIIWPDLKLDVVSLGLLLLALLPWAVPLVKSAKLPGGIEITFQDVQSAGAKVTMASPSAVAVREPSPVYLAISDLDPNLALAGLRIEIEKRLRAIAERNKVPYQQPLRALLNDLRRKEILTDPYISGLEELIYAGNLAAHGANVDPRAAEWAFSQGPRVLAALDAITGTSA
jgi:hypothetical protein